MKNTLITIPDQARKVIFIILLLVCIVAPVDPPIALLMGLVLALTIGHPFLQMNKKATTLLLQVSVVCLGFNMNLQHAMKAGQEGFIFTVCTIALTLGVGYLVGKWLKIDKKISYLISSGTAICGGSAIAAVSPVINANDHEMSVSLGTIFILNSIALFLFPMLGMALHLTDQQFGTWAAIAIHDTSSVVGAAHRFAELRHNDTAIEIATTIKLERALWIIPVALLTSYFQKNSGKKIKIPYFIFLFVLAIIVSTYFPLHFTISGKTLYDYANMFGKKGLVITLFLIGAGLSMKNIRQVGWRPILQGVMLWVLIGSVSLMVIKGVV